MRANPAEVTTTTILLEECGSKALMKQVEVAGTEKDSGMMKNHCMATHLSYVRESAVRK
jgi:N-acetylglutamate synthase/N-acetylornithine aminotransferase